MMDFYTDHILEHYHAPRHAGRLLNPSKTIAERNQSCGDQLTLDVRFSRGRCTDIAFESDGCALSRAAMSLLSEKVKGASKKKIAALTEKDVFDLLGITVSPGRTACALMGLAAVRRAIANE